MEIEKAIFLLDLASHWQPPYYAPNLPDAIKLGIEALKRILRERETENDPGWGHLASETLEAEGENK